MDEITGSGFNGGGAVAKRPRSTTSRRPRLDSQARLDGRDPSPPSTTPSSENASKNSTDGSSSHEAGVRRKEVNLNNLVPKSSSSSSKHEGATSSKRLKNADLSHGDYEKLQNNGNSLATSSWKNQIAPDHSEFSSAGVENKVRKVKLKVGGVTRTIHAKSNGESGIEGSSSNSKPPRPEDSSRHRQKLVLQEKGDPWRDFSDQSFSGMSKEAYEKASEPVRKSKRVPKRRMLDSAFDGEDGDEELRYLEKLKASKLTTEPMETSGSESKKKSKVTRVLKRSSYEEDDDFSLLPRSREGRKKLKSEREDGVDEEEGASDASDSPVKGERQESVDSFSDARKELSLTTRQRALQTGKDGSGGNANSLIEFPDGLPPAPPRRQKGKLTDVEQQLKKAEAAQRRRLQVEKAARESEAEAIRKILGQDSNRKKREEKLQKKREEMAQEKAAKSMAMAGNTVRWVLGPEGTTVTFPEAVGLPSIFDSGPRSYPAPREKCAGPTCTNPYRYRHSKLNLPLCSLQCYRAVEQVVQQ